MCVFKEVVYSCPPHTHAHNGNEEIKMLDLQTKDWKRL